jgi:predicted TIM-barrel fold metal-dependent hydrolase
MQETTMSTSVIETSLAEVADWDVMDVNVRVGPSGMYGQLALEKDELLAEMNRFGIESAVVSHFTAEEYDAAEGNLSLARDSDVRFVPAWAALPDGREIEDLAKRNPKAVRLYLASSRHNFSSASWCSSALFEYLQQHSVVTLISREDLQLASGPAAWDSLFALLCNFPRLPVVLLDLGYRSDRYLFPLLERFPSLHFDTSTYAAHRQLEAYVERFEARRAIFGSRLPLSTPGAALAVLITARVSDHAKLAIAGGNLRHLLAGAGQ